MEMAATVVGSRYGRLTVMRPAKRIEGVNCVLWECDCSCGNTVTVRAYNLRSGHSKSCGCVRNEKSSKRLTTHGHAGAGRHTHTLTYKAWAAMKGRCSDWWPRKQDYADRGITVCARWEHSYENFLEDMGEKPKGLVLDRIDNDKGYYPGNCQWTTHSQSVKNKRPFSEEHKRKLRVLLERGRQTRWGNRERVEA